MSTKAPRRLNSVLLYTKGPGTGFEFERGLRDLKRSGYSSTSKVVDYWRISIVLINNSRINKGPFKNKTTS